MHHHQSIACCLLAESDKNPRNSKCYLLELPFIIRHQIYYEAGLGPRRSIDMNFLGAAQKMWSIEELAAMSDSDKERFQADARALGNMRLNFEWPQPLLNLLYVCRTIHDEVEKVFYGENDFVITQGDPGGLEPLQNISLTALRELKHLTVCINLSSCIGTCCIEDQLDCGNGSDDWVLGYDAPLRNISPSEKQIIMQWQRLCARLADTRPNQLALYIVCDCADQDVAEIIIQPLLAMPLLRDCAIRLGLYPDKQLQSLAEDTVLRLTGLLRPQSRLPFRYLDLPKEIQLSILSHTSLVTRRGFLCTKQGLRQYRPYCVKRMDPYEQPYSHYLSYNGQPRCFCVKAHAAFTFYCHCGDPSISYFLVSQEFRQDAHRVFYRKNNFRVPKDGLVHSRQVPSLQDLESDGWQDRDTNLTLPFLECFSKDSIKLITSLTLEFRRMEPAHGLLSRAGWKEWLNTIDMLHREANLPALTLDIQIFETLRYGHQHPGLDILSPIIEGKEAEAERESHMRGTYFKLFRPMEVLRGLKDLFVSLNYNLSKEFSVDGKKEHEQILERMVMGEGYDAWKSGKGAFLDATRL